MSTAAEQGQPLEITEENASSGSLWQAAPLPSRALAAFIDYLVLMALLMFLGGFALGFDWEFLWSVVLGAGYFGIGNSSILAGQTLGKRAVGIRVIGSYGYLTPAKSILRYFLTFGIPMLIAESVPFYFRSIAFVGSPLLSELHMLVVLFYFTLDASLIVILPTRLALHDLLSESRVVRVTEELSFPDDRMHAPTVGRKKVSYSAIQLAVGIAAAAALCLWLLSAKQPQAVERIHQHRYRLEAQYGMRILSIADRQGEIELRLALPKALKESTPQLLQSLSTDMQNSKLINESTTNSILWIVFPVYEVSGRSHPEIYRFTITSGALEPLTAAENGLIPAGQHQTKERVDENI